jgi:hypothetical protein
MSALRASLRDGWTQRPLTRDEGAAENGGRIREPPGQPGPEIRTVPGRAVGLWDVNEQVASPLGLAGPCGEAVAAGQGAGVLRAQDPLVDGQQGCALVAGWR